MVGNTQNVAVAGGQGAYTAKSSDEKIATVTVDKTTITVKGVKAGKATILVKDSKNVMGSLRVTVIDGIIVDKVKTSVAVWRKRSIPTHSGWLYPLTFDAEKGLKED